MSRLNSRVRLPDQDAISSEDIFSASIDLLFPDTARVLHGDPGSYVIYASPKFGDIRLCLANPTGTDERWLFAHHLWNSRILLAEYIAQGQVSETTVWDVSGLEVLELGAGR